MITTIAGACPQKHAANMFKDSPVSAFAGPKPDIEPLNYRDVGPATLEHS